MSNASNGHRFHHECESDIFPPKLHQQVASHGIIYLLKAKHSEVLVQEVVTAIENDTELKLNILQGVHMVVAAACISLTSATIRNCFR
jgi:hypothetical protein